MNEQLAQISPAVAQLWQATVTYFGQPWFAYQLAIIVALYVVARLLAARIEPRLEVRARAIKGNPGLLRMVVALLRRTDLVMYTLLLGVVLTLM
ncbi:MAG TPA: hypothetical protein VMN03_13770, partial [Burkholderiales bacterium]|nr:hypothetical protein [Burkholderiales bacterium]